MARLRDKCLILMGTFVAHVQTMNVYKDLDQHYDLKLYDKRQHVSLIRGFFEYANLKMC